jgi:hypothetical protein
MLISTSVVTIPSHNGISDRAIPGTGEAVVSVIMLLSARTDVSIVARLLPPFGYCPAAKIALPLEPGGSVQGSAAADCGSLLAAISVQSR